MTPINTTPTLLMLHLLRINTLECEWRLRLCPGVPMENDDLAELWAGRPKDKPCDATTIAGIYAFATSGDLAMMFVHVNPNWYRPIDWRGLI